jgi:hypothetical protein
MFRYFGNFVVVGIFAIAPALAQGMNRGEAIRLIAGMAGKQLGGRHADIEVPDGALDVSAVELLGVPDGTYDEVKEADDGRHMLSGCRPQSCAEKGIVIFSSSPARLDAVGFRHFHCRFTVPNIDSPVGSPMARKSSSYLKCDKSPSLSIFILRYGMTTENFEREQRDVDAIRAWASADDNVVEEIKVIKAK